MSGYQRSRYSGQSKKDLISYHIISLYSQVLWEGKRKRKLSSIMLFVSYYHLKYILSPSGWPTHGHLLFLQSPQGHQYPNHHQEESAI